MIRQNLIVEYGLKNLLLLKIVCDYEYPVRDRTCMFVCLPYMRGVRRCLVPFDCPWIGLTRAALAPRFLSMYEVK